MRLGFEARRKMRNYGLTEEEAIDAVLTSYEVSVMADIYLKDWNILGDKAHLLYDDGTELLVKKADFNRAFGCIVSATKAAVTRDFAIKA